MTVHTTSNRLWFINLKGFWYYILSVKHVYYHVSVSVTRGKTWRRVALRRLHTDAAQRAPCTAHASCVCRPRNENAPCRSWLCCVVCRLASRKRPNWFHRQEKKGVQLFSLSLSYTDTSKQLHSCCRRWQILEWRTRCLNLFPTIKINLKKRFSQVSDY